MARRRKNPNRKTQNLREQTTRAAPRPPEDTNVRVFVYQTTRRKESQRQTERSKSDE